MESLMWLIDQKSDDNNGILYSYFLSRIAVLDNGQIVEFASPTELKEMKGVFYGMAKDAGLVWSQRKGMYHKVLSTSYMYFMPLVAYHISSSDDTRWRDHLSESSLKSINRIPQRAIDKWFPMS